MECPINDLVCGHPKIEDLVNSFGSDRNWTSSYTVLNLPILIAAEVGELSEHFTYLELQFPTAIDYAVKVDFIAQEIADVCIYILHLARICDIKLSDMGLLKTTANDTRVQTKL